MLWRLFDNISKIQAKDVRLIQISTKKIFNVPSKSSQWHHSCTIVFPMYAKREEKKNWCFKNGVCLWWFFLFHAWNFMFTENTFPLSCNCHSEKWFEVKWSEYEAKAKRKFNIQTFETLGVAHFAYLSQTTGIEVCNFITEPTKNVNKGKRGKKNRGEISISINSVVQMNPFVGEI